MNKSKNILTKNERLIWIVIVTILTVAAFRPIEKANAFSAISEKELHIFHEIMSLIENEYVENIDEKTLIDGAIKGMLTSLNDPHTRFMDEDTFKELQNETKGTFGGLGIEVSYTNGRLIVVSPIDDTPAMRAGIQPLDIITAINGKITEKMSLMDAIQLMRGDIGSSITLKLERNGSKDPITVSLVRELIKIKFVKSDFLEKEKIGYIRLSQFMGMGNTINEFKGILVSFYKKGAKGIVVDLRTNPGGLLGMAVELSSLFLPTNEEIVSIKGRDGKTVKVFKSENKNPEFTTIPLVVLINKGSASASEIFSGAMQDHKRAKIIGTQSFGKGSVQNIYNLPYNTGLALTIQKYYTPRGVSIHGKGITPDIVIKHIQPTEDEKYFLGKMQRAGLIESYLKKYPDYTTESFKRFYAEITHSSYKIREQIAKIILKNSTKQSGDLIDPEFDPDLAKAIEILK